MDAKQLKNEPAVVQLSNLHETQPIDITALFEEQITKFDILRSKISDWKRIPVQMKGGYYVLLM